MGQTYVETHPSIAYTIKIRLSIHAGMSEMNVLLLHMLSFENSYNTASLTFCTAIFYIINLTTNAFLDLKT